MLRLVPNIYMTILQKSMGMDECLFSFSFWKASDAMDELDIWRLASCMGRLYPLGVKEFGYWINLN